MARFLSRTSRDSTYGSNVKGAGGAGESLLADRAKNKE